MKIWRIFVKELSLLIQSIIYNIRRKFPFFDFYFLKCQRRFRQATLLQFHAKQNNTDAPIRSSFTRHNSRLRHNSTKIQPRSTVWSKNWMHERMIEAPRRAICHRWQDAREKERHLLVWEDFIERFAINLARWIPPVLWFTRVNHGG